MGSVINRSFFMQLLQLSIPVSLQFLLHSSRYIVDVLMLGNLGEASLAAVGLCTSIHMVANSFVFGLAGAIGLLCAQYFGAKNEEGINRTVNIGTGIAWAMMLPISAVFFLFPEIIISIATNESKLIEIGAGYLRITALMPAAIGTVVSIAAGINAIGKPHLNFLFTAVAVLLNVFLNWVLIFGHFGAPELGVNGAAAATIISILVEIGIIFIYLGLSATPIHVSLRSLRRHLQRPAMAEFWKVAFPLVLGGAVWQTGAFMYQIVYGHMGEVAMAAITMIQPLRLLCFSFFWGISSATGVMLGHLLGANRFEEAFTKSWVLILLGVGAAVMASVGVWYARVGLFELFGNIQPQTMAAAEQVLRMMLLTMWILAANVVGIVGTLQSGADNRFILKMDIFCQWAVGIPLCFAAAFWFDCALEWVYLAAFGEELVKLLIWIPRWHSRVWTRNVVSPAPI